MKIGTKIHKAENCTHFSNFASVQSIAPWEQSIAPKQKLKIWAKNKGCNRFASQCNRLLTEKVQNLAQNQQVQSIAALVQSNALVKKCQKCSVGWTIVILARFLTCQRRHGNKHMNLGVFRVMINQKPWETLDQLGFDHR